MGDWEDVCQSSLEPEEVVDDAFFRAMGLPIVRGRGFTPEDVSGPPRAVVINETMARRFWPAEDPVGLRIAYGGNAVTIVGIARDAKYEALGEEPMPYVYAPLNSAHPRYNDYLSVIVRTSGDPASGAQTTDQTLEAGLSHVVNNQHSAYFVRAIATTEWPGSSALSVLSVTITYQISEAQ